MKTIKLQSENGDINQDYLVDIIGNNEQFAIYDAKYVVDGVEHLGVSTNAIKFGLPDKNVNIDKQVTAGGATHTTLSMTQAVTLAAEKNLTMTVIEEGEDNVVKNTLTDFAWVTETLDAGVSGNAQTEVVTIPVAAEAQVETLTIPNTAGATQADYVVLTNVAGVKFAAWLDIDAAGTAPTGALYVAATNKVKVSIVTGGSAADNAAAMVAALEANENWAGITLLDNEDGTITATQTVKGAVVDAVPKDADDSAAGSISAATVNDGLDGIKQGDYIVLTNALSGDKVAVWFDVDAAGTVPTGANYVAADFKVEVNIASGDTSAANATAAYTALGLSDWAEEVTLTDNEDGTIDVVQNYSGVVAAGVKKSADDSTSGAITSSVTVEGTAGTAYEMQLVTEGGSPAISFTTESTLPEGLSLLPTGLIVGTPREDGTFALTITATDFFGNEVELTAKNLVVTETE